MDKSFLNFKGRILNCNICEREFGFKPRPLIWGNPNAKIVQISQAPSKTANEIGKPFTTGSGIKLREWYQISDDIFYNKNNFYITGISHCYPGKSKGVDRKPPIECAKKWLEEELSLLNNEIYIIVGREAAKFLFPKKDFKELIFNDQLLNNKIALVLPHPSPANIKWFKDNPDFLRKRLPEIRKHIKKVLELI